MSNTFKTILTPPKKMKNPDFDEIKKTTDIVRVVESYGIKLKKGSKEFVGLCPFHKDGEPSMNVNREKGVFHCKGCGAAGNAIQFVARKEGIEEKAAALKLCTQIPGVRRLEEKSSSPQPSLSDGERPACASTADRAKLLQRVGKIGRAAGR